LEDIGGPFETTRSYCKKPDNVKLNVRDEWDVTFGSLKQYLSYEGMLIPRMQLTPPNSQGDVFPFFPNSARSSNDALDELGATAISRCKPTNPPADAATALGELYREGLPHLIGSQSWKGRAGIARDASSDYLNVQFGWRPLLNDINSFKNTIINFDRIASQYERDSGKVVRRRYEFPIETSSSTWEENTNPVLPALAWPANLFQPDGGNRSPVRVVEKTTKRRWFSGAFTYHLPSVYDSRTAVGRIALLADRIGLSPTPDTIWNLAPWSWAIDWFSNTGDVISNVTDFATQGLVMHYGYVMEHSIVERTYYQPISGYLINRKPVAAGPLSLVTETKVRRQANPFGFGVSWEGLSTFQASILAALGISRRR
jgi:hypothetical protein